jgi:spermidine/putrescine-binding protein
MRMRRTILALAVALALAFSASAWAGYTSYAVWSYWSPGQGAGSSFSSSWYENAFYKNYGFDTTVTFIDNVSYSWHATVRNSGTYTHTHWLSSQVKRAHCRANAYGSYGACTVYN